MSFDPRKETNIEILRTAAVALETEVVRLRRENAKLRGEQFTDAQLKFVSLQEQIARQQRSIYGPSSEQLARNEAATKPERKRKKRKGHGPTPQPDLPVVEVEHALDEADQQCRDCGGALKEWQGQHEISEEVDVVGIHYVIKKHKRKKYKCECGHIDTALPPSKLKKGGRYSVGFAINVAIQKYLDHLPLHRQVGIMYRHGLVATTQTLWDQLLALHELLEPVGQRILEHILSKRIVGADETGWRLLDKKGRKKQFVWSVCGDDSVYYRICDTRATSAAEGLLGEYTGYVMADDYAVYSSLESKPEVSFTLINCWAHARRKFVEAQINEPKRALGVLQLIAELYRIEGQATGPPGSAERRESIARLRQEKSRPIVAALRCWALEAKGVLPELNFGKALAYMKSNFARLERFVEDPDLPLDNNATERALRGVVIGRKNHLGSRSIAGTKVSAFFYTLLESAKLAGVDPAKYLVVAVDAAQRGDVIPTPTEVAANSPG